tara:strand:- start:47 stop:274 length:228 start_codon:yes stop_codon:yes gene_type:complete
METEFLINFKDILDEEPNIDLNINSNFRDLDEWDSLAALSLIAMIDEEYNVIITGEQINKMNTLKEILDFIIDNK